MAFGIPNLITCITKSPTILVCNATHIMALTTITVSVQLMIRKNNRDEDIFST